jgi:hypothetical protein
MLYQAELRSLPQQRQKSRPPFGVQFSHDVVDEQHGRRSVNGRKILGLRHLQSDGDGALLPFAAELGGGFAVQTQLQFVAMRAEQGGAKGFLARPVAGQFDGEILADGGLVLKGEFSAAPATRW